MSAIVFSKLNEIQRDNSMSSAAFRKVGNPEKLVIPTYDGGGQPVHPSVVFVPGGISGYRYWMAFTPFTNSDDSVENPSIVASNDCDTWVVPAGLTNPVVPAPSTSFNRDCELIYEKGIGFKLFWGGPNASGTVKGLMKTSTNGITWSETIELSGDPFGNAQGAIHKKGPGEYLFWGQKMGIFDDKLNLGVITRYTSKNAISWAYENPSRTNLNTRMWHLGVLVDPSGYHFLACAFTSGIDNQSMDLMYGYSIDGQDISFDSTPVLKVPVAGTNFFDGRLYKSCMIPFGVDRYRIFFSYCDDNGKWGIGKQDITLNAPSRLLSNFYTPRKRTFHRTIFDRLEIRDTNNKYYGGGNNPVVITDLSEYESKVLHVYNSLDSDVIIKIYTMIEGRHIWKSPKFGAAETSQIYTIPSGADCLIDKTILESLGIPLPYIGTIAAQAVSVPTTGSLTVRMISY